MDATLRVSPHNIQGDVRIVNVRCIQKALVNVGVIPPLLKVLIISHSAEVIDVKPRYIHIVLNDCLVVQDPLERCKIIVM